MAHTVYSIFGNIRIYWLAGGSYYCYLAFLAPREHRLKRAKKSATWCIVKVHVMGYTLKSSPCKKWFCARVKNGKGTFSTQFHALTRHTHSSFGRRNVGLPRNATEHFKDRYLQGPGRQLQRQRRKTFATVPAPSIKRIDFATKRKESTSQYD